MRAHVRNNSFPQATHPPVKTKKKFFFVLHVNQKHDVKRTKKRHPPTQNNLFEPFPYGCFIYFLSDRKKIDLQHHP